MTRAVVVGYCCLAGGAESRTHEKKQKQTANRKRIIATYWMCSGISNSDYYKYAAKLSRWENFENRTTFDEVPNRLQLHLYDLHWPPASIFGAILYSKPRTWVDRITGNWWVQNFILLQGPTPSVSHDSIIAPKLAGYQPSCNCSCQVKMSSIRPARKFSRQALSYVHQN